MNLKINKHHYQKKSRIKSLAPCHLTVNRITLLSTISLCNVQKDFLPLKKQKPTLSQQHKVQKTLQDQIDVVNSQILTKDDVSPNFVGEKCALSLL